MLCYKITKPGYNDPDSLVLKENIKRLFGIKPVNIVQIGANDGISADPIYDYIKYNENVNAYLVEPQKDAFNLLISNYTNSVLNDRIKFYNCAITNKNDKIKLYKNNAVNGTDGHSSLIIRDKDICNGIVVADFNQNIYELVDGITVEKFMNNINNVNIDILIIDTEGYDLEIVKMFFQNHIYPKVIFFETPGVAGYIPDTEFLKNQSAHSFIQTEIKKLYDIQLLNSNVLCILKQ